jgi:hypothetical protein
MGNSGSYGPTTGQTYANFPWSNGFSVSNGVQSWIVPTTGTYTIKAAGAASTTPGRVVTGNVYLTAGQTVSISVGQSPVPLVANVADNVTLGGAGGTFITLNGQPLIVASGGDGGSSTPAAFTPAGTGNGSSGGGYYTNGSVSNPIFPYVYPRSYTNDGNGCAYQYGKNLETGGFGGGQCPLGLSTSIQSIVGNGTTAKVTTVPLHGYPNNYRVVITGTVRFNGSFVIQTTGSNTFTFSNAVSATESTGTVTGVTSGGAGGGGYSGSNGAGTGATCFANTSVVNFTDLGASSNTSGYVTVSLGSQTTKSWNNTSIWTEVSNYLPTCSALVWSDRLQTFYGVSTYDLPPIATTPDGILWSYPKTNLVKDVYRSIAVSPTGNLVTSNGFTSFDGITWSKGTIPTTYINYFASDFNGFISTVNSYLSNVSAIVYVSANGLTWNPRPTGSNYLMSVQAYSNSDGTFLGIDTNNNLIKSGNNQDLRNWAVVDSSQKWNSVAFGNGLFVACAEPRSGTNGTISTSTDGTTWTQRFSKYGAFTSVTFTKSGYFLVLGYNNSVTGINSYGTFVTSTNGINWTYSNTYSLNQEGSKFPGGYSSYMVAESTPNHILFQLNGPSYITDGQSIITCSTVTQTNPQHIAWSPQLGMYVVIAIGYIYSSSDGGTTWIIRKQFTSSSTSSLVAWSDELGIFVVYVQSEQLFTSSDGINWTSQFPVPTFSASYLEQTKSTWSKELGIFATGNAISPDGIHWTTSSGTTSNALAWSPTLMKFAGVNTSGFLTSSNGLSWTSTTSMTTNESGMTWSPKLGKFIACVITDGYTANVYTSSDGTTWAFAVSNVLSQSPFTQTYGGVPSIQWAEEIGTALLVLPVLVNESNPYFIHNMYTSTNGTTWTFIGNNLINTTRSVNQVIWTGSNFAATNSLHTGIHLSSSAF